MPFSLFQFVKSKARLLFGLFFVVYVFDSRALASESNWIELADSVQWLKLGHYQKNIWGKGHTSQVDDHNFFLATDGKTNPESELKATLKALRQSDSSGDLQIYCRFPARAVWLHKKLPQTIPSFNLEKCEELQEWRARVNAHSISLIFPASYINSPSSMFGHTLLRIDPPKGSGANDLLSWALNYGANADVDDGALSYAYRGLTGGYFGTYSIVPYFEKVKEYNDIDNRDIFEYQLNLNSEELRLLLLHAWELKGIKFQYYYFDENCAYQLLTLLEVARPNSQLTDKFVFRAIPADTVRVIDQAGFIEGAVIRPSAKSEFNAYSALLSAQEHRWVKMLVNDFPSGMEAIRNLEPERQFSLLKQAYRYSRLLAVEENKNDQVKKSSYQILSAISVLPTHKDATPKIQLSRTEKGHYSQRWGAAGFYNTSAPKQSGMLLSWRPAYHDWLDPIEGYALGANIEFLDTEIYLDESTAELHRISIAQVQALRQVDTFFNPTSWYAGGGFERDPLRHNKLDGYIHTGRGKAAGVQNHLWYGFASARYEIYNGLMPGGRIGWLYQGSFSFLLEADAFYSFVRDTPQYKMSTEIRLRAGKQFNLRLMYGWYSNKVFDEETLSLGFYHFY